MRSRRSWWRLCCDVSMAANSSRCGMCASARASAASVALLIRGAGFAAASTRCVGRRSYAALTCGASTGAGTAVRILP